MNYWIQGIVAVVLLALIAWGMVAGWRRRARRTAELVAPPVPAGAFDDAATDRFEGQFVAVTAAGQPLERITAGGLGFRGLMTLEVAAAGILLSVRGAAPLFVAAASIRAAGRGTWTIDRVVEPGGLVVITAEWGDREVDLWLGPQLQPSAADLIAAVRAIAPAASATTEGTSK